MKLAETVTFGGGGLDRAAHMRDGPSQAQAVGARVLPVWHGKVPVTLNTGELVLVRPDHPVLDDANAPMVFLGLSETAPRLAADISSWSPDGQPEPQPGFFDASEQQHPAFREAVRFVELRGVMARLSPIDAEIAATAKAILGWHRLHGFCAVCGVASDVTMAGWQRQCPACGGTHFPRTDPVVIMLITHGNSVLVGRSPGWPDGMYSLLAGFLEPGETIEAAVRREVAEEAGIEVGAVSYLASQPWPYPSSLMIGCKGEALGREITLDPIELDDALWLTREDTLAVFSGQHSKVRPARMGSIAHFLLQNWLADRLD